MVLKKPRSSLLLPTTLVRHARSRQLDELNDWLWNEAPLGAGAFTLDMLRTYLSLICDSVLPASVAREALLRIWNGKLRDPGRLEVPAQRGERSARKTVLTLAPRTRFSIRCSKVWKTARSASHTGSWTKSRVLASLKSQLTRAKNLAGREWSLSMADIAELAPLVALRAGAEPYHFTVLKGRERPVSQDETDPYQLTGVSGEMDAHLLSESSGLELRIRNAPRPVVEFSFIAADPPPAWIGKSRDLIRRFSEELGAHVPGHCNSARKKERALAILAGAREQIPESYPESCVTRMAVDFAESCFVDGGSIKASTLRTYLDRCVTNGLLDSDAAYALADWDPEDFIDNIEARLDSGRLSTRSKGLILQAYSQFLRFACPRLRIPRVSLAGLSREFIGGPGQWRLISPHAIDHLLMRLTDAGDPFRRQVASMIVLAYYGGMRASEIRKLSLSDIIIDDTLGTFEIEVLRGKSANARRRIPFHALAGRYARNLVRAEWASRRSQFPSAATLSRIAFLGPPVDPNGYDQTSLLSACRAALKAAFGDSANIHMLRHSFCSILFLRWYAIRHFWILFELRDRFHDIYQSELQGKLVEYFHIHPYQEGPSGQPQDLISMINITGHATPGTFFTYYVHSYSLVHADTVDRVAMTYLDKTFRDRVIKALVPGMRSSASRARLKKKTIREICRKLNVI